MLQAVIILKSFLHVKKMANSLRNVLPTYSEICIFCVIQYIKFQKQSMEGALKVLGKSLKTVLDEVRFILNLYSFALPLSAPGKPLLPACKSFALLPGRATPPLLDTSAKFALF